MTIKEVHLTAKIQEITLEHYIIIIIHPLMKCDITKFFKNLILKYIIKYF